jgi:hypothetical protein
MGTATFMISLHGPLYALSQKPPAGYREGSFSYADQQNLWCGRPFEALKKAKTLRLLNELDHLVVYLCGPVGNGGGPLLAGRPGEATMGMANLYLSLCPV